MPDLADFQSRFAEALLADEPSAFLFRSQAFAVYRNTSARGAVEALRAGYPTVDALIGEEMFTAVALDYRRKFPPASPVLSEYGGNFPAFLADMPWATELPYVADVAELDRLWLESFLAPGPEALFRPQGGAPCIVVHPATRFAWLATPALTIWQAHRDGFDELEPQWREEGALFTRAGPAVQVEQIDRAAHRLLLACTSPVRVDEVVGTAASDCRQTDIPALLRRFVAIGALLIQ